MKIKNNEPKKDVAKLFGNYKVRTYWDSQEEDWWFSVVDVVNILCESKDYQTARKYWNKLKERLKNEGSELVTFCHRLKILAKDGKLRETDCLNTQGILRLIQSIPSKNAEPFKIWLAKVGKERIDEITDPEKAIVRGVEYYRAKGYHEKWITQRLRAIDMRNELTAEWKERGITEQKDYAILTNEISKAWSGLTIQEYKKIKNLKKENLRDNMTNLELVLSTLAEVSTTAISKAKKPENFKQSKLVAQEGGKIAYNARKEIEEKIQQTVISSNNAKNNLMIDDESET